MPRSRRRRYAIRRAVKTQKYSNETYGFIRVFDRDEQVENTTNYYTTFVPITAVQATRKCKNFTLRITTGFLNAIQWALVYVPEGTAVGTLRLGASTSQQDPDITISQSVYEPNQNVIMSGMTVGNQQTASYKTRLARNLNSGDAIVLVYRFLATFTPTSAAPVVGTLNYAIAY